MGHIKGLWAEKQILLLYELNDNFLNLKWFKADDPSLFIFYFLYSSLFFAIALSESG